MKKIHLICNAHLDLVWQWQSDEGISAALSTFASAAKLCEEHDYIFCHNEALLYEAVETHDPALFVRIRNLIRAGKWRIIGGWYLQPDCNMPSGESLVRQISTGRRYFLEKFGVKPEVAVNFDSFGHSVGLVQILAKSGFKGYLFCRPAAARFDYPSRYFTWVGADGSKVICGQKETYNSGLGEAADKIKRELPGALDTDCVLWGSGITAEARPERT